MRYLGSFLRYILNINTVWGIMILVAFLLCVSQHYLPTTTVIPAERLQHGMNTVTIQLAAGEEETGSFDYQLTRTPEGVIIPSDQQVHQKDRPWLISVRAVGKGFLLKWDAEGYGEYAVSANDVMVGRGRLVTLQALTDAAFDYARKGFDIALGLVAAMVLFLGLMKVGEDAGIVQLVARLFYPVIRLLFPEVPKEHPANGAILMNVTTTILGLGNAATPFGLKAMKELESLNPHPGIATDSEIMLLAYNTAGLALLPTTLLAVRKAAGCSDPFEIIGTCMVTGAVSTVVAITMAKLLGKVPFFSVRAALAEGDPTKDVPAATEDSTALSTREEKQS